MAGNNVENSVENFKPYIPFTKFVSEGDWDKAKECLKLKGLDLLSAVRAIDPKDEYGDAAIHVAAIKGHVNIVKELMLLMTHEDLKMGNARGYSSSCRSCFWATTDCERVGVVDGRKKEQRW